MAGHKGGGRRRPERQPTARKPGEPPGNGDAAGLPVSEVLAPDVLDELRATVRPSAFTRTARALADAVVALAEEDSAAASGAARAAKQGAPRSAAVREVLGLALYRAGDFRAARTELAAAQRMSGRHDFAAVLADLERATGRPEQAVRLFETSQRSLMAEDTAVELLLVAAAAYGDMRKPAAGVALIRRHARWPEQLGEHHLRLAYTEGELAEQAGDRAAARTAFARVARVDHSFHDVAERLAKLEG